MVPIPANEQFRLEAVRMLNLTGGDQVPALNELVRLASQIFDVPIAVISLIDETVQNAIAATGEFPDVSRNAAICAHTLLRNQVMVVPDAALDDRFHQSQMVINPPHMRFYAGAPLIVPEGFAIGTMFVMDRRPRSSFDGAAQERLADLAGAAVRELLRSPEGLGSDIPAPPVTAPCRQEKITEAGSQAQFAAFADLAHDIHAGLNEIKQASEALDAATPETRDSQFRALIDRIQASASYVQRMADQTLELARLRGQADELHERVIDLADLIEGIFARHQALAFDHNVRLGMAPMTLRPKILVDSLLVEQMVTNLTTNAIIHSPPEAEVHCAVLSEANGELVISLRNTGITLTDHEINLALQPFQIVGNRDKSQRTAGLGLPIVQKMIEMHGGEFELTSDPAKGVEACLRFPAYRVLSWYTDRDA